jgi:hypothetical protein
MGARESPCRVHVYLAHEAKVGVVLRRGPSEWARLSLWRTDTDAFEHGQWFRGRVYERRCDVSHDGSLFAYFARKSSGGADIDTDSWIAVSRPPWFTALALWPMGGTYVAGGLFVDGGSLFLGGVIAAPDQGELAPWLRLTPEAPYIDHTPDWTDRTVYFNRLLRDGWTPAPSIDMPQPVWERRQPDGDLTLVMAPMLDASFDTYGGRHAVEYALLDDGEVRPLGRGTWADWDHRGRLIIAQDGRLLEYQRDGNLREIADFNGQTPDPQPSPAWAREWPGRR